MLNIAEQLDQVDQQLTENRGPFASGSGGGNRCTVRQRVRIRFSKSGDLRFIGHHDLVRALERLFRRAQLPLAFSQGYHPKPRISFPLALALGIEGHNEVLELELSEALSGEEILARLAEHAIPGLQFLSVEVIPPGAAKARVERVVYEIFVPEDRLHVAQAQIDELCHRSELLLERPGRNSPRDYRSQLENLDLENNRLRMVIRVEPNGSIHPREILRLLGLDNLEAEGYYLVRTNVELAPEDRRPSDQ
ncbi:MAG: TIGR03936 family radical SAM-associated protein [Thermogutta sp.]